MTRPHGRYRVEVQYEVSTGRGWMVADVFDDYEAASWWGHALLGTDRAVRVVDTAREIRTADAVVWEVSGCPTS